MLMSSRFARLAVLSLAVPIVAAGPAAAQIASAAPGGKAVQHHSRHHRTVAHRTAPPQPRPPAATPVASTVGPAPVPNEAVSPPGQPAPETQVAPSVFQLHYPPVGEGYVTGSSPQAMDDRNAAKATGVQMTVPLQ